MRLALVARLTALAVFAVALACAWLFLPITDYVREPEKFSALIDGVRQDPLLPGYLLATFVVAGALFVSVWLVIFETCLLYPPMVAFPLALGGAMLSSMLFYGLGRLLGRDVVEKLAPPRVRKAVEGATIESLIALRVLPILPYTFVNMSCGAFGVPVRTFVLGSVIGMTPGITAMCFLGERVLAAIRNPSLSSLVGLVVVLAIMITVAQWMRRRAAKRLPIAPSTPAPPPA